MANQLFLSARTAQDRENWDRIFRQKQRTCNFCHGKGEVSYEMVMEPCPKCNGTGKHD